MKYYYANPSNETVGPFNMEELKNLAAKGDISPDTVIITEETMQYTKYSLLSSSELMSQETAPAAQAPVSEVVVRSDTAPTTPPKLIPLPSTHTVGEPTQQTSPATPEQTSNAASAPQSPAPASTQETAQPSPQQEAQTPPIAAPVRRTNKKLIIGILGTLVVLAAVTGGVLWLKHRPSKPSDELISSYIDGQLLSQNYKTGRLNHEVTLVSSNKSELTLSGELLVVNTLYEKVPTAELLRAKYGFENGALTHAVTRAAALSPSHAAAIQVQPPKFEAVSLYKVVQAADTKQPFTGTLQGNLVEGKWSMEKLEIKGPQNSSRKLLRELPTGTNLIIDTPLDDAKLVEMIKQATAYIQAVNSAVSAENEALQQAALNKARAQQALAAKAATQPSPQAPLPTPKPILQTSEAPKAAQYSAQMPETAAAVLDLAKRGVSETVMILRVRRANQGEALSPEQLEQLRKAGVSERILEALLDPKKAQFSK